MTSNPKAGLVAALLCGYVLGRTKKGRLALTVLSFIIGRRLGGAPRQLAAEGLRKLTESPQFSRLTEQVRGELLGAARSAATAVAERQLDTVSEAIHKRTEALRESRERPKKAAEEAVKTGEEAVKTGEEKVKGEEREGREEREEGERAAEEEDPREVPRDAPKEVARKSTARHREHRRTGRG